MTNRRTAESILQEIKESPEHHCHINYSDLAACCTVTATIRGRSSLVIDVGLIDAHGAIAPFGYNGGRRCDVVSGPCACGAWH